MLGKVLIISACLLKTVSVAYAADSQPDIDVSKQAAKASSGDAKAALWLAHFYEKSGNKAESKKWLNLAAKLGNKAAIVEIGYGEPYIATTMVTCGAVDLNITTSCSGIDEDNALPACYIQRFAIRRKNTRRELFLFNQEYKSDLTVANQGVCVFDGRRYWLVIESTNFGTGMNCVDCERSDYIDDSGNYVGSTKGRRGAQIVVGYKLIGQKLGNFLSGVQRNPVHSEVFEIKTYPTIQ
ncbi:MAG: hypothetical protein H6R10_3621 [Rhodocyclaceae bacterium]|nr:hypothetical protein [Rhodocyclaceae bacterium]